MLCRRMGKLSSANTEKSGTPYKFSNLQYKALMSSVRNPDSDSVDLLIYGSTPGGVACALRSAREGLRTVMVSPVPHLGGLFSSGLSTMDTLYNGPRAPIYDELRQAILEAYRSRYGEDSEQYRATQHASAKTKFEARVVEAIIEELLGAEEKLTIYREYYPLSVKRQGRLLSEVVFQPMGGGEPLSIRAMAFADCSYEADLAVAAGIPCRVGRESRDTFGEEHAGRIFMKASSKWPPEEVDPAQIEAFRRLNLIHYRTWYSRIPVAGDGVADPAVQAYNLRTVLTTDPENRIPIDRPQDYDRETLIARLEKEVEWRLPPQRHNVPNQKCFWNFPKIIGPHTRYVEGDWATRRAVAREHAELTLHLLYFLQNDPSIDPADQTWLREWGLPKDEFPDNGHLPYEIYMRETRRIVGRAVFTEHDARRVSGMERAPVHADSISATEWFIDSHSCTNDRVPGSKREGEIQLKNLSVPGQVPFATMLPDELDNLLVPVCLSSSHVGWGTIRLEPTWMSLGEAAAWAVIVAARTQSSPASVDRATLLLHLAEQRVMLTFFNDLGNCTHQNWYPAFQYLGTCGYFGSYDARPGDPLGESLAEAWASHTAKLLRGDTVDPTTAATHHLKLESQTDNPINLHHFHQLLQQKCGPTAPPPPTNRPDPDCCSRADAVEAIFQMLARRAAP